MTTRLGSLAALVASAALLSSAAACNRGPEGQNAREPGGAPAGGQQALPDSVGAPSAVPALASDPVIWLEEIGVQLPRSTATHTAAQAWEELPAAKVPDAGNLAPQHRWLEPAILIGTSQLYAGSDRLGPVACAADLPEQCTAQALSAPTAKQLLHAAAADVDEGGRWKQVLDAAQARGWAGKTVWLLADRRIAASAVLAAERALRHAGATPQLGVATLDGQLAVLLPATTGPGSPAELSFAPSSAQAPAELPPGAAPTDLVAVRVQVRRQGVHLMLTRPQPAATVTPELLGSVVETLCVWAERARVAAPHVRLATVQASADAPWEEVVRVVDALRDTCGRAAKGTPCHDRRPLYEAVVIAIDSSPASL